MRDADTRMFCKSCFPQLSQQQRGKRCEERPLPRYGSRLSPGGARAAPVRYRQHARVPRDKNFKQSRTRGDYPRYSMPGSATLLIPTRAPLCGYNAQSYLVCTYKLSIVDQVAAAGPPRIPAESHPHQITEPETSSKTASTTKWGLLYEGSYKMPQKGNLCSQGCGGFTPGGPGFLASSTAHIRTQLGSLREPLSESRHRAAERRSLPAMPNPAQHTDGSLVMERQRGADGREMSHHFYSQHIQHTEQETGIDTRCTV